MENSGLHTTLSMKGSIISWLLLAISTISIFFDVAATSASAECLGADQRSLLLELKNSLVFDTSRSTKLVRWGQSADSWSGVTCEDGLVVGLDLSEELISGGIDRSSSLFKLKFLRSLNLAFNNFNFLAIPSSLANLNHLVHLNLSAAPFGGQIPAELSRLTKLRTLDLSGHNPVDSLSLKLEKPSLRSLIGDMGELRELYLDRVDMFAEGSPIDASLSSLANLSVIKLGGNNLSATVPSILANFSSLKTLSLFYCGLQGEFPQKVFQVQTLQTLLLSDPLLRVSLLDFPENSSLETLFLRDMNISGRLPDSIGNLRKLSMLVLINCSLSGSIPSSMENLSELTFLDLSWNNLTGSLPSYGASRNLTDIYLSNNALTGQITSVGWENLLNLVTLDLGSNSLEGDIPPMFTLPHLENIDLSTNRFSGQLIINLNVSSYQLQMLDLAGNLLQGSIPTSIFELRGLYYLSLSSNNFSGSMNINALLGLRNLTFLNLSYSGLSIKAMASTSATTSSFPAFDNLCLASCQLQTLPWFLANQSFLIYLDLADNYIRGEIPRWIWTLRNLELLNLSSNFFEDSKTPHGNFTPTLHYVDLYSNMLRGNMLPMPSQARYLDFSSNNITSVIPDNIGDYLSSSTMFFSLSKNNFHGSIPKSICKAAYSIYLEVLDLSHNLLNGIIPDCLMKSSLKVLNLRNNQLSGNIPQNIPTTCSLKTLDLSENLLQGQIPLSLANCMTLEILNIGNNQINGTFPCHFMAISSLHVLILRSNKLHGEIGCAHSPFTWQMLQIIDVSSNDLGGMLPASLLASWEAMKASVDFNHLQYELNGTSGFYYQDTMSGTFKGLELELVRILTIFTSIDFSNNRFEGPIPNGFGDLKALYFLNLSHNAISGSIPPILGNLDQLESLDLSWNYLNGIIPVQLANLDYLSFLNLSNNQLVGSIPDNRHFLTFSESSFERNLGLCGLQLNKSCSIARNSIEEAVDDGNNDDSKKWFFLGIPLGFVVGFWVFCGPLVFIRSWRIAYYRFWDKVLF
ncbi:hypothetical protein BT93_G1076 [Corymbia citriodora subsp. variegata]|nr:hypothetical protein BT93_G1076 [Corymbia citriodora subsp. variegata]